MLIFEVKMVSLRFPKQENRNTAVFIIGNTMRTMMLHFGGSETVKCIFESIL